ncbi:DsrE family protein [Acidianus manzaensis]|uniref:Sulfur reductase DrsE n=1 Tax=Acidianus manzaensis TaxID=282676 RepID=A0A1W6JXF9_9CREN|nr:DsrE family protein [Acidianus manzaensis]ARM74894.1 sulfur reductase DrsE [Acidianus manzaensis]
MYRVIVQVKDLDKAPQSIKSVINLYNDLKDVQIEVVFHQSAIRSLVKDSPLENSIMDLINKGIVVVGCMNSINSLNIDSNSLISGIKIVQSGVGEVVRKQSEGWIYLSL